MSLATDMKECILQHRSVLEEQSGAKKEVWEDFCNVKIALYEVDELSNTQSIKYHQCDYVGLSFYLEFDKKNNQIKIADEVYTIEKCKVHGQLANLLLKRVVIDGTE